MVANSKFFLEYLHPFSFQVQRIFLSRLEVVLFCKSLKAYVWHIMYLWIWQRKGIWFCCHLNNLRRFRYVATFVLCQTLGADHKLHRVQREGRCRIRQVQINKTTDFIFWSIYVTICTVFHLTTVLLLIQLLNSSFASLVNKQNNVLLLIY